MHRIVLALALIFLPTLADAQSLGQKLVRCGDTRHVLECTIAAAPRDIQTSIQAEQSAVLSRVGEPYHGNPNATQDGLRVPATLFAISKKWELLLPDAKTEEERKFIINHIRWDRDLGEVAETLTEAMWSTGRLQRSFIYENHTNTQVADLMNEHVQRVITNTERAHTLFRRTLLEQSIARIGKGCIEHCARVAIELIVSDPLVWSATRNDVALYVETSAIKGLVQLLERLERK